MPAVWLFVGACAALRWRGSNGSFATWRGHLIGVALAAAGTTAVALSVPATMRVQFDETSLVAVSQSMHRQRSALLTTGAIPFDGEVMPIESTVDKRPPLFAFCVSLLHDLRGYRVDNAFLVNALLLAVGLFVAHGVVRARLGPLAGATAPVLLLSVPLTSIVATSAGFELIAAVCLLLTVAAAADFCDRPDRARFAGLLGAGMLFAQTRYESLPALTVIALVVWLTVRRRFRLAPGSLWLLACCPALVAPLLLLLDHSRNPNFYPEAGGRELLAWQHFADHLPRLLAAWFDPRLANPLPGVVAIAAAAAVAVRLVRRQGGRIDLLVAVPVGAVTTVTLAWFFADADEPAALRLYLPLAWATALAPLASYRLLGRRGGIALLVVATCFAGWRIGEVASGRATSKHDVAVLTEALDGALRRLPGDRATTLWVGSPAQHLITRDRAALPVRSFLQRQYDVVQLTRRGDLRTIYLLVTPLDEVTAAVHGRPQDVLRRFPGAVVERIGGAMPITVYRLQQ